MAQKAVVKTENAPAPFQGAPYSQGIVCGDLVFVSGQLGLDPSTGRLADGIAAQTEQVMQNIGAVLEASGSGLDRLVKTTIFLADLGDLAALNEVYARHVGEAPPARSTFEVAALPSDALVEIEAVAHL